ncbi:putative uroporphyrin-III c-methyltransferase [Yersinia frederiksenii]|nr:putative uroporphyrin-III c-methyltransferase [Yersinia frederiksenii]CNH88964.1 putative uroporphyrin-III c-methyltransferase [Yersinia frederiksenii]CNI18168.1 putative uroporphyrin-III c-methyltransferase [Yersinia frederiksenii]
MSVNKISLQRVYDVQAPYQANTFLVDRLWPRGISKARLEGVIWLKEVAPDNALRQWFHQHLDWPEFVVRYQAQLNNSTAWQPLLAVLKQRPITLLYGSRNAEQNQAIVLRDFLISKCAEN